METEELIPATECCTIYKLEYSFIKWLNEYELLEFTIIDEQTFIHTQQLPELEKYIRLHFDLDINLEGIQAINTLLNRINNMQHEINLLHNKLNHYETSPVIKNA